MLQEMGDEQLTTDAILYGKTPSRAALPCRSADGPEDQESHEVSFTKNRHGLTAATLFRWNAANMDIQC